jgi:hypothetical protein
MAMNGMRVRISLLIFVLSLSGCSQEGKLIVKNEGATEFQGIVENTQVTIDPDDSYTTTIYIGKTLAFIGPSGLTIPIAGSAATKRAFSDEIEITNDETTTYSIIDDVGACSFVNRYYLQINNISMKLCASTTFSPGILEQGQTIAPGTAKVIQFDPGCWDILVNYGREERLDTVTAIPIEVGDEINIPWVPGYVYTPPTPPPAH